MYKQNTVFVIGAGASAEFGLPVGTGLMDTIKRQCAFDPNRFGSREAGCYDIYQYYQSPDQSTGLFDRQEFEQRIRASQAIVAGIESADSIDEFIFRHSDDLFIAEVGKLNIAYAIAEAERKSILANNLHVRQNFDAVHSTWIWSFFRGLINGVQRQDMETLGRGITLIVFNYDRCIQHYLEHALMHTVTDMKADEARSIVANIEILHPYGSLGDWRENSFGNTNNRVYVQMAYNLMTWSESIVDAETIETMRLRIKAARQIVFLGFGFATQNMNLMNTKPTEINYNLPSIYSTGRGIAKQVQGTYSQRILSMISTRSLSPDPQTVVFEDNATCTEFFNIHRPNLMK